jgi:hypothetical protein
MIPLFVIGLGLIIVLVILFRRSTIQKEGYATVNDVRQVTFCPHGTTFYTNDNGQDICCDGQVTGRRCNGKKVCTFGEGSPNLPNCSAIQGEYMKEAGSKWCPSTMPHYYEMKNGQKGCTSEGYMAGSYTPVITNKANACNIYKSQTDNIVNADSCMNQKILADMKCIMPGCNKGLQKDRDGFPPFMTQSFKIDGEVMPRSCVDRESAINYLNYALSKKTISGLERNMFKKLLDNIDKDIRICNVAERILVHKMAE